MNVVRAVRKVLDGEAGEAITGAERQRIATEAAALLSSAISRPRAIRDEPFAMEMMVGMRSTMTVGSLG